MWMVLCLGTACLYAGGALLFALLARLLYVTFFRKKAYELTGLCCAVTGASDGLGVYIATALAAEKVKKLVLGARREEKLQEVKADLMKRFPSLEVLTVKLDVTDSHSRSEFLRKAMAFGPCQVLINNAGVDRNAFFDAMSDNDMDAMLQTNLVGTIHLTKIFLQEMMKGQRGHVVNISSISAKFAVPFGSIYGASKAALSSLTASLRLEMILEKKPVTFHCVSPGLVVDAGMAAKTSDKLGVSVRRAGGFVGWTTPEKVADAVVRAIQYDEADIVVNSVPVQVAWAVAAFFPKVWEISIPFLSALGLDGVVKHFRNDAGGFLDQRPLLVDALRSPDLQEAVVSTVHDILACHVPEESPDAAKHGFVQAGRIILKALLDPLALGMGWDAAVKRRCVMTLAAITKELLQRAKHCQPQEVDGASLEAGPDPEVQALLETYARLLVHSLEVSSELHEGLLQCLVQLANDEAGRAGLLPRARELAELCASHLLQTPSAQPLYVRQAKAELATSESPQRTHRARELTRELAMVCCLLLQRLAQELLVEAGAAEGEEAAKETSEEPSLEPLREQVLTSLHRDNLNLHRLTRGHEPLRRAIAAAHQAWEAEVGAEVARPPPKPRHRGMKSALAMRELLEEQEQKKRPGRSQPRKPAKDADGAVRKDAQAPAEPLEPPEPPEPGPGRPGRPGRPDGTASVASDGACSTGVADGVAAGEEQDYDVASYCSHVSEASFWLACGRPQQLLRSKAGCHQERAVRRTMATTRYADVESQLQGVSAQQVRLGFVRKVYGIVCAQVMFTALFGALCCWGPLNAPILRLATSSPRLLQWGTLIASLVALAMCQLGKDRYPINMLGLCFLTAVMSLDVGVVCAMVAAIGLGELVVQAAVITSLLTLGLTLYTFKSKRDFSFLGAALWPLLFGLVVFSLLSVFFPSLQMGWTGLLFSFAGAGIFCAYIVFDTWRILNQMNCDDYVQGAIQLYLDIVNLFLCTVALLMKLECCEADDASLTARGGCEAAKSITVDHVNILALRGCSDADLRCERCGEWMFRRRLLDRFPGMLSLCMLTWIEIRKAGRMSPPKASKSKDPPREAKKDAPVKTAKDAATEVTPDALMAEPGFTPEVCPRSHSLGHEDCPVLAGVFDYLAAGRVELAMQCIFSLGNEQTLRAVLQRLDSDAVWPELPKPEAQHLARLLVALVCRDPFSSAASEACPWLEALLRRPHGENLLPAEELLSLQGALFSASAVGGDVGPCAARLYFQLFQRQVQASASCPQLMFSSSRASAVPVILPQCLWIGNGGGREDIRFVEDGGFDGAYTYFAAEGFTPGSNTKSWKDTAARLKKLGKLFVPSVGPGYDDTRVRPWNSHNIRERKGGEYYSRMWSAAVGSRPYAVSVTSYNEWGEGTQIEPAKRHRSWKGAKYGSYEPKPSTFYLTETKRWSDQFKAAL
ncbi:Manea [Symbiodinium necroappetens]|uniref:Manea protein n=1 Tax=Symbiodinium necroappetens TaxID=1628268 RepID=A0A812NJG4_9DINO|nr:Manea [Symbiodinium necroappetens]